MISINEKEARQNLKQLLDRVEQGEEVEITRHGRLIAHIVPHVEYKLPSLKTFRQSLITKGASLSGVVKSERFEE